MVRFGQINLIPQYNDACRSFLQRLVYSNRFRDTLGQIYDGEEIWTTHVELGNTEAVISPTIRASITHDAAQDVEVWIAHQSVDDAQVEDLGAKELAKLLNSSTQGEHHVIAITLCLIEPLVR
ncbi:hypothetical protein LTS12_027744, partial [Elasticomyces elasticus]